MPDPKPERIFFNTDKDHKGKPYVRSARILAEQRLLKLLGHMGMDVGQYDVVERHPTYEKRETRNNFKGAWYLDQFPEVKDQFEYGTLSTLGEALYQYDQAGTVKKFFAQRVVKKALSEFLKTGLPEDPQLHPETQAVRTAMRDRLADPKVKAFLLDLANTGDLTKLDSLPIKQMEPMVSNWVE
jgi:hypothetical protein